MDIYILPLYTQRHHRELRKRVLAHNFTVEVHDDELTNEKKRRYTLNDLVFRAALFVMSLFMFEGAAFWLISMLFG